MNHPLGKKRALHISKKIIDRIKEDNKVFMELENTVNSRLGNPHGRLQERFTFNAGERCEVVSLYHA